MGSTDVIVFGDHHRGGVMGLVDISGCHHIRITVTDVAR